MLPSSSRSPPLAPRGPLSSPRSRPSPGRRGLPSPPSPRRAWSASPGSRCRWPWTLSPRKREEVTMQSALCCRPLPLAAPSEGQPCRAAVKGYPERYQPFMPPFVHERQLGGAMYACSHGIPSINPLTAR